MSEYSDAISDWLQSTPWDYFFTITTRRPRRDSVAFIRDIRAELEKGDQTAKIFVACEPFKYNHDLHAHGLLLEGLRVNSEGSYRLNTDSHNTWDGLFHKFGRTRLEVINSRLDVADYCTKYVTKLTDGDNWNYFDLTTG